MMIGLTQAEKLKSEVLSLTSNDSDRSFTVRGRRIGDGVEVVVELSADEMSTVMQHIMQPVVHLIRQAMRRCTPEMADDFLKTAFSFPAAVRSLTASGTGFPWNWASRCPSRKIRAAWWPGAAMRPA